MLVDINLLPQKEKKRGFLTVLTIVVLLLVVVSGSYSWLLYNQKAGQIKALQAQLTSAQSLKEVLMQKKDKAADDLNAEEQLRAAITWAENDPVSTFTLLRHIASLLPERGYVRSFSFEDSGDVQLTIQFDSSREAAFFLKSLEDSPFVSRAQLLKIGTESVENEPANSSVNKVLPRYIADYQLKINQPALKESAKEGEGSS